MKVGFISDLHIDRNFEVPTSQYLAIIRQTIAEQQLDLLVIGGDISNHFTTTFGFVEELQKQAEIAEARLINDFHKNGFPSQRKRSTFNEVYDLW